MAVALHKKLTDTNYPQSRSRIFDVAAAESGGGVSPMNELKHIRAVVFKEGHYWVAQCLELDIGAQAPTLELLGKRLKIALEIECKECLLANDNPFESIPPAPDKFQEMWANANKGLDDADQNQIRTNCVEVEIAVAA